MDGNEEKVPEFSNLAKVLGRYSLSKAKSTVLSLKPGSF